MDPHKTKKKNKTKKLTSSKDKKEELRIPRPKGFTMALSHSHKSQDPTQNRESTLNYLRKVIVEQYVMDNNRLNGEITTLSQLAQYLNIPLLKLNTIMTGVYAQMYRLFDRKGRGLEEITRAKLFQTEVLGSESRAMILKQISLLVGSQGDTYKPFISSEVNKALGILISAGRNDLELLKILAGMGPKTNSPGLTINNNLAQSNTTHNALNTDMAVALIRENSRSFITDPDALKALPELQDEGLPDISARTQDLAKIGIKMASPTPNLAQSTDPGDNPKHAKKASFEHGDRGYLEVLDEDDFKA